MPIFFLRSCKLFDNDWMPLAVIDPESDDLMYRYIPKQGFEHIPA